MTEPVKLSRERWEMLAAKPPAAEGWCYPHSISVSAPREINGITFLPATYVPGDWTTNIVATDRSFFADMYKSLENRN